MDLTGEERIEAPRDLVWQGLNDPDVLRQCVPGCERLEYTSPTELAMTVKIRLGPLSARFHGTIRLDNLNPPQSYRISAEGKGGIAGFAKGAADVSLIEADGDTLLRYTVTAEADSKLAKLGARFIDMSAQRLASVFFQTFHAALVAQYGQDRSI